MTFSTSVVHVTQDNSLDLENLSIETGRELDHILMEFVLLII